MCRTLAVAGRIGEGTAKSFVARNLFRDFGLLRARWNEFRVTEGYPAELCSSPARIGTKPARGFTLVELLIVISIIGVLIALLMPAVKSAQESGRRAHCLNNVEQLALANLAHESAYRLLPGGGWGWGWVGDADRGSGMRQPGGWVYNILPYIDQNDLHDMGKGLPDAQKQVQNGIRTGTPTAITLCPTRRRVQAFTWWTHGTGNFQWPPSGAVGRSDYASNGGDNPVLPGAMGLWSSGNCMNADCGPASIPTDAVLGQVKAVADTFGMTGIDYPLSTISLASITDGLSFTYLLGEKALAPNMYLTGQSNGDNENQYIGFNSDVGRFTDTNDPPIQDTLGNDNFNSFGSAHSSGFNMAFCDGSARPMSYAINLTVHQQLGNRKDGLPTDLSQIDAGK